MKFLTTFASFAVAASVGAPSLASAQTYRETIYDHRQGVTVQNISDIGDSAYGALPPFEVVTIVRSMGFEPQSQPVLRGRVYIVRAFDDQDIPVRVAVDARTGRVVNVAERGRGRFGQMVEENYGAYPVPPSGVPTRSVYGEPDYRLPPYREPAYGSSSATVYTPAPYEPASRAIAPRPRLASRTPAAAPVPRAKPQAAPQAAVTAKPATPPAATATKPPSNPAPQGAAAAPAPVATSSVAQDTARRGTSIPAPVAARKVTPPAEEITSAKPTQSEAATSQSNPALVPVAPLE